MTCEDCIHCKVCYNDFYSADWCAISNKAEKYCESFKDKSNFAEVVRCKDCVYLHPTNTGYWCNLAANLYDAPVKPEHFCGYGEKERENNA